MRPPERAAQRPWSLAFLDRELEEQCQAAAGQESLGGFRMTKGRYLARAGVARLVLAASIGEDGLDPGR